MEETGGGGAEWERCQCGIALLWAGAGSFRDTGAGWSQPHPCAPAPPGCREHSPREQQMRCKNRNEPRKEHSRRGSPRQGTALPSQRQLTQLWRFGLECSTELETMRHLETRIEHLWAQLRSMKVLPQTPKSSGRRQMLA
ncbi:hypothetical protein DPEC_G00288010 [Dallia pectoralis]|uniref:Uncharacterized protein n=1 Tax=Dallia pectoralis TaxID=75939 RepID=A0ACC2FKA9_DALPE|nr:hypothetical protein DPEC_G00288010 [Dallia pectoralis]